MVKPVKKEKLQKINMSNFSNPQKQAEYKEKLQKIEFEQSDNTQLKWKEITQNCIEVSKEIMGTKAGSRKVCDTEIKELSNKNKLLKKKIDSAKSMDRRTELKVEKQKVKNQIRMKIGEIEKAEIEEKIKHLEEIKNDANKYYQALR